ncbi:MAG: LysM peptidoglycan-binding domain-containing protein [Syntrophomonadaceae bacterium]|nr:LysM peptidoglycan-binding domain-containing protein [Syntrophomonadaceae bacterium]
MKKTFKVVAVVIFILCLIIFTTYYLNPDEEEYLNWTKISRSQTEYIIQEGDSIGMIARTHGISMEDLLENNTFNDINDFLSLQQGQKLSLPVFENKNKLFQIAPSNSHFEHYTTVADYGFFSIFQTVNQSEIANTLGIFGHFIPLESSKFPSLPLASMLLADDYVGLQNGERVNIKIYMLNAVYHQQNYEPGHAYLWTGDMQINIYTDNEEKEYIIPWYTACNDPFSLYFDDYNGDGNPDFTYGTPIASSYVSYRIFTILPDCSIKMLTIGNPEENYPSSGFVMGLYESSVTVVDGGIITGINNRSRADYEVSIPLYKIDDKTFGTVAYYNMDGGYYKHVYQWQDDRFAVIENVISDEDEMKKLRVP